MASMHQSSFKLSAARLSTTPVLAFDLGGTWFRCGLVTAQDRVQLLERRPSISIQNNAAPSEQLREQLIEYLVHKARTFRVRAKTSVAAVSIGAAINMNTGRVVASAPLWGHDTCDLDLVGILSSRVPELSWTLLNDVTALAMRLTTVSLPTHATRAAALTVSSGIAYRTIDLATGDIPVDPDYGLQGEIGHLPTEAYWRGRRLEARCDCGAMGHVSAFSSGRAIVSLLADLPELAPLMVQNAAGRRESSAEQASLRKLTHGVQVGEPIAMEFLRLVTLPLANVLLHQMTLSPEVGFTVVSGGVPEGLGQPYLHTLTSQLEQFGLYGVPARDIEYFRRRMGRGSPDGLDALRGAAIFARGSCG